MANRTDDATVRGSIETDSDLSLTPFIRRAHALTDYVESQDSESVLTDDLLREIETCLACHYYDRRDHAFDTKKTADASGKFQGQYALRLDSTKWGQDALVLDVSGTLRTLNETGPVATASAAWVGLPPSQQTRYTDRD